MLTDTEIKLEGMQALTEALGMVQAERFIALILREPFDYTQWQKKLWPNRSIEHISQAAIQQRNLQSNEK
jgi:hypothetical protein